MRAARYLAMTWLVALMGTAGCSNNTGPVAGTLDVSLSSPYPDDGAVLFWIAGGPVDSVEAVGFRLYSARSVGDTLKLIATGNLGSGPIARIHISDARQAPRYAVQIGQVAVRGTYAARSPAGYVIRLLP